jgi:hypothetical protein
MKIEKRSKVRALSAFSAIHQQFYRATLRIQDESGHPKRGWFLLGTDFLNQEQALSIGTKIDCTPVLPPWRRQSGK